MHAQQACLGIAVDLNILYRYLVRIKIDVLTYAGPAVRWKSQGQVPRTGTVLSRMSLAFPEQVFADWWELVF